MPAPVVSAPASVAFGAGLSFAGFWAAAPLGIPMTSLAWGVVFAGLGVVGRGVYEAQQTLGKHDTLGLRFVLAWVLVGLLGAPFGAALVLYGLKLASVQSDNITAFALMFMGFTGPKGVTFVFSAAGDFFNKKFGLSGPGAIPPPIESPGGSNEK